MGVRIYSPLLVWQPLGDHRVQSSLSAALLTWEGTPYESGQRFRQRGADCIGAVFGVVDQMDGRDRAQFPGMPQDTSMHDPAKARGAVRELVRRYSPCVKVASHEKCCGAHAFVEPGDILVTGSPGGGPGHVMIVGSRRNELWHCIPGSGFHRGGWGLLTQQILFAVYRIEDKERWA